MSTVSTAEQRPKSLITCDQALRIAHTDAIAAYRNLDEYRITVALASDGWHVDYELTNQAMQGGGPHYIIDANNGIIRDKRYEQ